MAEESAQREGLLSNLPFRIPFVSPPNHLKNAKLLHKGVNRFLKYKADIVPPEKLEKIASLNEELRVAYKAKAGREEIEEKAKAVHKSCDRAIPPPAHPGIQENLEVIFVAIVIAVGIRTYCLQPFRIPTGSMQPTLNGIVATGVDEWDADSPEPNLVSRFFGKIVKGRSYVDVVAKKDMILRAQNPLTSGSIMKFFNFTKIHMEDGSSIRIFAPQEAVLNELGLGRNLGVQGSYEPGATGERELRLNIPNRQIKEGQVLARGYVDTGDQVLVDKFSYHFRTPKRGEVFVFNTTNITGIQVDKRFGSQHYIKRLVGVPGDSLSVQPPELQVNGKRAEGFGFERVMSMEDGYNGYVRSSYHKGSLNMNEVDLGEDEYFAMGDNSLNSSDSRMWGKVPEPNLVGPAFAVYWPFTSHWGRIR